MRSPLATPHAATGIEVKPHARPGRWKATIRLPGGERLPLHRPDDPLGEARAQLAICGPGEPRIIAIVGGGLGFLTEAAHERYPNARIVVMEPFPLLAQQARVRTPALYDSGLVHVVVGPRLEDHADLWRLFDVEDPDEADPPLVLNPALQRALPSAMARAVLLVRRATSAARMNARARRENAGRYVVNTLRNLPHIVNGADPKELVGQFTGVPAVLVAAGPSLDRNLEALRHLRNRALIVATDTTWRPLVSAGIDPHLVVALDPSPLNGRHLSGIAAKRDTWVLAEGSIDPDVLRTLEARVATFRVGMHHPWPWLSSLGVHRPLARVWGSVLTAVFDLSLSFGCDPLVFVGADLAYTDGRPYCRGTAFERDWAQHVAAGASLREVWQNSVAARAAVMEPDVHGQGTRTAAHLIEFRNWLVAHAGRHPGRRILNATGAGILHGSGIEQIDLESALSDCPDRGDTLRDAVHRLIGRSNVSAHQGAVVEALARIEEATSAERQSEVETEPVRDWLAFGKPSLARADIHMAAKQGRADLESAWAGRSPRPRAADVHESPVLRLHEADRVARMRALLTNDRTGLDGCSARDAADAVPPQQARAWEMARILGMLLALPELTTAGTNAAAEIPISQDVPLSHRFRWTSVAAPWVAALEELLLEDGDLITGLPPSMHAGEDFWTGQIEPVVAEGERPQEEAPDRMEHAARLELTSLKLRLLGEGRADSSPRAQRMAHALLRGATFARLQLPPRATYRLDFVANDAATPLPLRIDALTRVLTGTLAWAGAPLPGAVPAEERPWPELRAVIGTDGANDEPRLRFVTNGVDHVEPDILTGPALPRGFSLSAADRDRVVFVSSRSATSVLLSPDGVAESGTVWPIPISGEVSWGAAGGALAWSSVDSTILLRAESDSAVLIDSVPFRPIRVARGADGSAYWSAADGGIWTWLPGTGGRLLATAPAWGGFFADGDDLVIAPLCRDDHNRIIRQRLPYEWRCSPTAPELRQVPTSPEGQCFGLASRGRWTARPYPFSDLIRLESSDGHVFVLACHSPTAVAWAGDSLVAGTSDGDVLLFRRLVDRLTALITAREARTN